MSFTVEKISKILIWYADVRTLLQEYSSPYYSVSLPIESHIEFAKKWLFSIQNYLKKWFTVFWYLTELTINDSA